MSHETPKRHLIAYDIPDDPRRTRIAKTLETYGDRVQYSVFIVDLRPAKLLRLRATLNTLIDHHADSVLICDLGTPTDPAAIDQLGRHRPLTTDNPAIII
ncbi:CRISPR-associated endonuclease Cas2 [Saccharopolyspora sp. 6M]|uniref:CRISPR-associated endonuclease Cas2 n=1 Tax=Saccharopolyspora sp. 6M TaxID=2877237 RepID=UPI001CD354DA|nr:CRISPR-associated endonuclease Cas2 [Saccharopolyspora sp. 6M]MCA1229826.1 CRISPR-associated endonuclease Cas2 [Saccharopolyspora sp. 6M]